MAVSLYDAPTRDRAIAEINITPLVDVMLVLLVIFLLSMPIVTRTLPLQLPTASRPQPIPPARLALDISATGELRLDGAALPPAALDGALAERLQHEPRLVLQLRASSDSDYRAFAAALAQAQRSGVRHIVLAE